ncbi:Nn.00g075780.m01.CDS01 [Neocucurbitaria sp. VM-36]
MTTFYQYGEKGLIASSTLDPIVQYTHINPELASLERNGDVVGAYLARRSMCYPADVTQEANRSPVPVFQATTQQYGHDVAMEAVDQGSWYDEGYDSHMYSCSSDSGYSEWHSHSAPCRPYPNLEHIRHFHTLHSLLPSIQPERRLNALNEPTMNITEQYTGRIFAYLVPKKLLVLFLGRQMVNKFIRTIEREDNEHWRGGPVSQELHLPHGVASTAAVKILVGWMIRACQPHAMHDMEPVRVPVNTFVACSLAQTMNLLGLHRDATRVDVYISQNHFVKPIFADELKTLWNCFGGDNKYVYTAIKVVGKRLRAYEEGLLAGLVGVNEMLALLNELPDLSARVRDAELNEMYQPVFRTEWTKKLGNSTSSNGSTSLDESRRLNHFVDPEQVYSDTQRNGI